MYKNVSMPIFILTIPVSRSIFLYNVRSENHENSSKEDSLSTWFLQCL